jgi:hypothetical protein
MTRRVSARGDGSRRSSLLTTTQVKAAESAERAARHRHPARRTGPVFVRPLPTGSAGRPARRSTQGLGSGWQAERRLGPYSVSRHRVLAPVTGATAATGASRSGRQSARTPYAVCRMPYAVCQRCALAARRVVAVGPRGAGLRVGGTADQRSASRADMGQMGELRVSLGGHTVGLWLSQPRVP